MLYGLTAFFCKANFIVTSSECGTIFLMKIKLNDIYRATLATHTGNEGWVGVDSSGQIYHVITPVDTQIAKGVMACNRPNDGTPFGGYSNWLYHRCRPYCSDVDDEALRLAQAETNLSDIICWLSQYGIEAQPDDDRSSPSQPFINTCNLHKSKRIFCRSCEHAWNQPSEVFNDPGLQNFRYRARIDDFSNGLFIFRHSCGGEVEVPVSLLIKTRRRNKSLAGSRACPELCSHETISNSCNALCEGSAYRKLAFKIAKKRSESNRSESLVK